MRRVAPLASVKSVVVGVDGLRGLARTDVDRRQRGDQAARVEHLFYDGQHVRMHRDLLPHLAVLQQVVDAQRVGPFERVGGRRDVEVAFEAGEVVGNCVD
jgi:hypothetical protein